MTRVINRKQTGRGLTIALSLATGLVLTAAPQQPAKAVSTGAAVGIGLGSFALGTMLGAGAYPYQNYGYYGYPYTYYYPPYYYPPPASYSYPYGYYYGWPYYRRW